MADYIMTVQVMFRVKNTKDDYEAWEFGENFLTFGLESLAMSTDDEIFKVFFCVGVSLACVGGVFWLIGTLNALWPMILIIPSIALGYSLCDNMLF